MGAGSGRVFTCGGGGGREGQPFCLGVIFKILIGFGWPYSDKRVLPGGSF